MIRALLLIAALLPRATAPHIHLSDIPSVTTNNPARKYELFGSKSPQYEKIFGGKYQTFQPASAEQTSDVILKMQQHKVDEKFTDKSEAMNKLLTTLSSKPTNAQEKDFYLVGSAVDVAEETTQYSIKLKRPAKSESPMLNHIFDSYASSHKHTHDMFRAPAFEEGAVDITILDVDTGSTVVMDCRVSALKDRMVSWIRAHENDENKNLELLTLGLKTHTMDFRYRVDFSGDNWRLELMGAEPNDSGVYYCQVSTHPPMLKKVRLTVHSPVLEMQKETFLEAGEKLSLQCSVRHLHVGHNNGLLRWYRDNITVALDEIRGGVLIQTDNLALVSQLQVAELTQQDAGIYICALESPLKMKATSRVHVLQGSSLAELQSAKDLNRANYLIIIGLLVFLCIFKPEAVTGS